MYRTIIWATDGSEEADRALDEAVRLAQAAGGRIVAVHGDRRLTGRAAGWPALPDEEDRWGKISRQVAELHEQGIDAQLVVRRTHHEPADAVSDVAREVDADVIVCGTRGFGAVAGAVFGSFTQRLLHVAPCAVLAVPERVASRQALHAG